MVRKLKKHLGVQHRCIVPKGMGYMNGGIMTGKIAEIEKPAREPVLMAWGRVAYL